MPHTRLKTFLTVVLFGCSFSISLFTGSLAANAETRLYACYEDEKVGFLTAKGMRQVNFQLDRFTLKYDVDKNGSFL